MAARTPLSGAAGILQGLQGLQAPKGPDHCSRLALLSELVELQASPFEEEEQEQDQGQGQGQGQEQDKEKVAQAALRQLLVLRRIAPVPAPLHEACAISVQAFEAMLEAPLTLEVVQALAKIGASVSSDGRRVLGVRAVFGDEAPHDLGNAVRSLF